MVASSLFRHFIVLAGGCSLIWMSQGPALAANTLTCPTAKLASITVTSVQLSGATFANGKVVTPPSQVVVVRPVSQSGDALSLDDGRNIGTCTFIFDRGKQPAGLGYLRLTLTDTFVFAMRMLHSGTGFTQTINLHFAHLAFDSPAPVAASR